MATTTRPDSAARAAAAEQGDAGGLEVVAPRAGRNAANGTRNTGDKPTPPVCHGAPQGGAGEDDVAPLPVAATGQTPSATLVGRALPAVWSLGVGK